VSGLNATIPNGTEAEAKKSNLQSAVFTNGLTKSTGVADCAKQPTDKAKLPSNAITILFLEIILILKFLGDFLK
jgi:hypothetical protein